MSLTWLDPADDAEVADDLVRLFHREFGATPEGVWAAPGRVNLIGEHTDYNDGFCLPLALPHRTYAAVARRDDGILRIRSRQKSKGWEGRIDQISLGHPRGWTPYVAGVLAVLAEQVGSASMGMDVVVDGRVPLGAGLSSSAALSCSIGVAARDLVPGLRALSDAQVAAACVRAENEFAGAATGGMDQTVSMRAVEEHLLLLDCRDATVVPVAWTLPACEVLVIDTRAQHSLADGQYAARRTTCEWASEALGVASLREITPAALDDPALVQALSSDPVALRRVRHVVTENERVLDLVAALAEQDADSVGTLMTASHVSLRDDYEVSARELDVAVTAALDAGASGARMTGGGFGGSAIALVRRDDIESVAQQVARAFEQEGLRAPAFLVALPSRSAGRIR